MTAVSPSGNDEANADASREEHLANLRDTFKMIDTDGSGTISSSEFGSLLRLQGEHVTDADAAKILNEIDVDGDASNLTFDEFVAIMDGMQGQGGNKFDLASAFTARAKEKSSFLQAKDPLYIRMQRERARLRKNGGETEGEEGDIGLSSSGNARMALAAIVDGNTVQVIVLVLIVLDVICVVLELVLLATKCPCLVTYDDDEAANAHAYGGSYGYGSSYGGSSYSSSYSSSSYGDSSSRRLRIVDWMEEHLGMGDPDQWGDVHYSHRMLSGDGVQQTCIKNIDGKKNNEGPTKFTGTFWSDEQHDWEVFLHLLSVGILCTFALQITLLFLIYCLDFFKEPAYILDAVVVFGAIYIESDSQFTGGSLFTILLSWRFLRVFHGLYTSFEVAHKQQHEKISGERGKMLEMIVSTRRKGAKKKMYFNEFHDKLHDYGVDEGHSEEHAAAAKKAKEEALANGKGNDSGELEVTEFKDDEIAEEHGDLKKQLQAERERRAAAESMYVEIFEHLEEHMDTLKEHSDVLNGHGGGNGGAEHSHAEKMKTSTVKKQSSVGPGNLNKQPSGLNLSQVDLPRPNEPSALP